MLSEELEKEYRIIMHSALEKREGIVRKSFDELTIADDYMFYRVMKNTDICKTLLNMVLYDKTDTITDIQLQKNSVRRRKCKGSPL